MDFLPDDEQIALTRSVADLLAKRLPDRRAIAAGSFAVRPLLKEGADLGWLALAVPEADGGVGASLVEEVLVFSELGRAVAPGPFLATLLAARVAVAGGEQALADRLMAGDALAALALPTEHEDATACRLLDHAEADVVVIVGPGRAEVRSVPACTAVRSIDELTPLARADLAGTSLLAAAPDPAPILLTGWVLASALLSGIAEATRDMSVAYLKDRHQFGKPIGSFQGLKHQAADSAVEAEAAHALTNYAALAVAEGHDSAPLYCMAARVVSHRAALHNARANVQHHGAMGVTFEHDAHFYVKRTHVLGRILGGVDAAADALIHEPSPLGQSVG
jgi:alkylation response protein AidB-like acyl-CoA dehydrogenase